MYFKTKWWYWNQAEKALVHLLKEELHFKVSEKPFQLWSASVIHPQSSYVRSAVPLSYCTVPNTSGFHAEAEHFSSLVIIPSSWHCTIFQQQSQILSSQLHPPWVSGRTRLLPKAVSLKHSREYSRGPEPRAMPVSAVIPAVGCENFRGGQ